LNRKYDAILKNEKYESVFAVVIGVKSEEDKNQPVHTPKRRLERRCNFGNLIYLNAKINIIPEII
jgi:hypothetical protein